MVIESTSFNPVVKAKAGGLQEALPGGTMSNPIRVGIVGARFAAQFHLQGYRRVYGVPVDVVGVTSKSVESREAFAAKHKLRAFASVEQMCEAVDVVDICAPGSAHEPIAVEA